MSYPFLQPKSLKPSILPLILTAAATSAALNALPASAETKPTHLQLAVEKLQDLSPDSQIAFFTPGDANPERPQQTYQSPMKGFYNQRKIHLTKTRLQVYSSNGQILLDENYSVGQTIHSNNDRVLIDNPGNGGTVVFNTDSNGKISPYIQTDDGIERSVVDGIQAQRAIRGLTTKRHKINRVCIPENGILRSALIEEGARLNSAPNLFEPTPGLITTALTMCRMSNAQGVFINVLN